MNNICFGIVILSWNNYIDTKECIVSLKNMNYKNFFIVLVDNGSVDGSCEKISSEFKDIFVLVNSINLGVPTGYNRGFKYALDKGADAIVMLNNDTIVDRNMLNEIVENWDISNMGIAAPIIYEYNDRDKIWTSGVKKVTFPPKFKMNYKPYHNKALPINIEYAIGCCIIIKREVFNSIGFLDESIFFMWEDIEFSYRVRHLYNIVQIPTAKVWHKISKTTDPSSDLFWFMHGESSALFFRRTSYLPVLSILWYGIYFIIREFIIKNRCKVISYYIKGIFSGINKPLNSIIYYE